MSATYAGTHYRTIPLAALSYAVDALPDISVIDPTEDPTSIGSDLEACCYDEASQAGCYEVPTGDDGEQVDRTEWRGLCRGAIAARIVAWREDLEAVRLLSLGDAE